VQVRPSASLKSVQSRHALEVPDVCGEQWPTGGEADPGYKHVAFTDGCPLEDRRAFCKADDGFAEREAKRRF
jgi:hypothetical protein